MFSEKPTVNKNELDFFRNLVESGPGIRVVIEGSTIAVLFSNAAFRDTFESSGAVAHLTDLFSAGSSSCQTARFRSQLNKVGGTGGQAHGNYEVYQLEDKNGVSCSFGVQASLMNGTKEMYCLLLMPDHSRWGMPITSADSADLFLEHFDVEQFATFEWLYDVSVMVWSQGMYRIFETDAIERQDYRDFILNSCHPSDRAGVSQGLNAIHERDGRIDLKFRIRTKNGSVKHIHMIGKLLNTAYGQPLKYIGSIRDVTEQAKVENSLKSTLNELRRSNRELEEFAYVASHDMQEPLRKISTFNELLIEKYGDVLAGDGSMYISRIVAAADNMRMLISGLLDFSRISKTSPRFVSVDLGSVLKDVASELELQIAESKVSVEVGVLPVIDAIEQQLKQLFLNLVGNAIKFRSKERPSVIKVFTEDVSREECELWGGLVPEAYIKLVLEDNGIGVEEEYAERIFEVFQRLHGKAEYPGSGIGLSICKKIVTFHKGIIYYRRPASGFGAGFVMLLPKKQSI